MAEKANKVSMDEIIQKVEEMFATEEGKEAMRECLREAKKWSDKYLDDIRVRPETLRRPFNI